MRAESGGEARGCEPLAAATVLGCMPNVVANRVSQLLDVRGPCFTIASEEASGTVALEIAIRALRERDVDTAVVGRLGALSLAGLASCSAQPRHPLPLGPRPGPALGRLDRGPGRRRASTSGRPVPWRQAPARPGPFR